MSDTATIERPATQETTEEQPEGGTVLIDASPVAPKGEAGTAESASGTEEVQPEPEKPAERGPVEVTLTAPVYVKLVEALVDPLAEGGVEAQEEKLTPERRSFLGAIRAAKKTPGKEYVVALDVPQQDTAAGVIDEIRTAIKDGKVKLPSKMTQVQFDRSADKLLREVGHGPVEPAKPTSEPRAPRAPRLDADGNPIVRKQGSRPELTVIHGKKGYTVYDERNGGRKSFGHTDEAEVIKFVQSERESAGEGKTVRAHMLDWTAGRKPPADSLEKEL